MRVQETSNRRHEMQQSIAYGTVALTITLVMALPRTAVGHRAGPAGAACFGVAVLLIAGIVGWSDIAEASLILWRPLMTILSMMVMTAVAQQLGLLEFFAGLIAPAAGQPVARAFRSVFVLSVITATALNNDAAILLLTPAIVGLVRRAYPRRPDLVVPFAFAVFSAAGVAPLVISNPMNTIVAAYAGIGFNDYAARMAPIALAGWGATYLLLRAVFRHELRGSCEGVLVAGAAPALSLAARQFIVAMALSLACYPVLTYAGAPLWPVAAGTAAYGLFLAWRDRIALPGSIAAMLPWEILVFLFGIFVIGLGLQHVGFVGVMTRFYASVADPALQTVVIGVASALGSALLNNHPTAILNALAIHPLPGNTGQQMLAALIGGDLGPRLLPMGSLAGLLWIDSLRRQGVRVSLACFVAAGAAITVPTLLLSLVILLLGVLH
jgi:arsenical pump membrane protein